MDSATHEAQLRQAAFDHVNRLVALRRGVLDAADLAGGFEFGSNRIPLINPQRGIFKPRQMEHLLGIKTVFARKGAMMQAAAKAEMDVTIPIGIRTPALRLSKRAEVAVAGSPSATRYLLPLGIGAGCFNGCQRPYAEMQPIQSLRKQRPSWLDPRHEQFLDLLEVPARSA